MAPALFRVKDSLVSIEKFFVLRGDACIASRRIDGD